MSKRFFEGKGHADVYAKYRPTYPDIIFTTIVDFYNAGKGKTCNYELLVDVGCGNGQSSRPFCKYFRQVIGTDISENQIAAAQKDIPNLTFRLSAGEDLSFLEDSSVDVVTIATALHWVDRPVFFKEVERVLKPGGVLAAFGYFQDILDDDDAQKCKEKFYNDILGDYWDEEVHYIRNHHGEIELPFADYRRMGNETVSIRQTMTVDAYIGWMSTLSACRKYLYRKRILVPMNLLKSKKSTLKAIYKSKTGEENAVMNVVFPGYMLIGRKAA